MHGADRRRGQRLQHEVAIGHGIERVPIGWAKPSAFAVMIRSIGNDVPASAAAPSGLSLSRLRASARRPRSRAAIST
jgi:hypothetical protein